MNHSTTNSYESRYSKLTLLIIRHNIIYYPEAFEFRISILGIPSEPFGHNMYAGIPTSNFRYSLDASEASGSSGKTWWRDMQAALQQEKDNLESKHATDEAEIDSLEKELELLQEESGKFGDIVDQQLGFLKGGVGCINDSLT